MAGHHNTEGLQIRAGVARTVITPGATSATRATTTTHRRPRARRHAARHTRRRQYRICIVTLDLIGVSAGGRRSRMIVERTASPPIASSSAPPTPTGPSVGGGVAAGTVAR